MTPPYKIEIERDDLSSQKMYQKALDAAARDSVEQSFTSFTPMMVNEGTQPSSLMKPPKAGQKIAHTKPKKDEE